MLPTPRALLLACLASIPLGCGDSGGGAGFVVGGPDEGGVDDAGDALDAGDAGGAGGAGGSTGGTGGSDASAIDDDAGTESIDPCPIYCERVLANCTGLNLLYPDEDACLAACDPMPHGDEGDTSGNSAWCRAHHASEAASTPDLSCAIASESGNDVCGTPCEAYCDQVMAHCRGADRQFDDRAACETACAGYPSGYWYDTTGNTVQCRIFHASFSAAADPAQYCPAAGESGGRRCL